MKKKIIIVMTATILTIGAVIIAYAKDTSRVNTYISRGGMPGGMHRNNSGLLLETK